MTLKETLAALDAKATQGAFEMLATDLEHDFGVPIIGTDYPGTYGPSNGLALWATMLPTEIDAKDASRAEENARFVVTLVNLYRTGQLVVAPSVEEVAPSLTRAFCENVDDWMESRIDDAGMGAILATAALTSMGAKTDGN